jgi:hypothetical protein
MGAFYPSKNESKNLSRIIRQEMKLYRMLHKDIPLRVNMMIKYRVFLDFPGGLFGIISYFCILGLFTIKALQLFLRYLP